MMTEKITLNQRKQLRILGSDAVENATNSELNLNKDYVQELIIAKGNIFKSRIEKATIEIILDMAKPNKFTDQVVKSTYSYPKKFTRKPEEVQVMILAKKFGIDPKPILKYLETISGKPSILPSGCHPQDGNYAIISPFGFQEIIKGYKNPFDPELYCKSLLLLFEEIKKERNFSNYRDGKIDKDHLRQKIESLDAYEKIASIQGKSPIWIIPAQYGFLHKGESVNRAREIFIPNEFGLGSVAVGCMGIVHPERYVRWEELDTDCAGDEFSPDADGVFSGCPLFNFSVRLEFGASDVSNVFDNYGSVSAFAPQ